MFKVKLTEWGEIAEVSDPGRGEWKMVFNDWVDVLWDLAEKIRSLSK